MGAGYCVGASGSDAAPGDAARSISEQDHPIGPNAEHVGMEDCSVAQLHGLSRIDKFEACGLAVATSSREPAVAEGPLGSQRRSPRSPAGPQADAGGPRLMGAEQRRTPRQLEGSSKMMTNCSAKSQATSRESQKMTLSSSTCQGRMAPCEEHMTSGKSGASIMQGIQRKIRQLDNVNQNFPSSEAAGNYLSNFSPKHLTSRSQEVLERPKSSRHFKRASASVVKLSIGVCALACAAFTTATLYLIEVFVTKAIEDPENAAIVLANARRTGALVCAAMSALVVALGLAFGLYVSRSMQRVERHMQTLGVPEDDDELSAEIAPMAESRITDIQRLQSALDRLRSSISTFHCFLPKTIVNNIVAGKSKAQRLHVERREVSIMFSDIKDFTSISESMNPPDLMFLLTRYLDVMCRIVHSFHGLVAEILGDGLLVFWNTPDDVEDHQAKAAAAALAMQRALGPLNADLEACSFPSLHVRIGLHTGKVLTGNMGSLNRMKFGCMGDAVNLCSRLEGLCKIYGVRTICSAPMYDQIKQEGFFCRKLDIVRVKGKTKPTEIYEVIGLESHACMNLNGTAANTNMANAISGKEIATLASKAVDESSRRIRMSMEHATLRSSTTINFVKSRLRFSRQWNTEATGADMRTSTLTTEASGMMKSRRSSFSEVNIRYSVCGVITQEARRKIALYEQAFEAYQAGDFLQARDVLEALLHGVAPAAKEAGGEATAQVRCDVDDQRLATEDDDPSPVSNCACPTNDRPAEVLLERVMRYISDDGQSVKLPAQEFGHWDGIFDLTEK